MPRLPRVTRVSACLGWLAALAWSACLWAAPSPKVAKAPPTASAEATREARALFVEGERAFEVGRFLDAARKFEEAHVKSGQAKLLWNIALAYKRQYELDGELANLKRARAVYANYAEVAESELERAEGARSAAELTAELARRERVAAEAARPVPPPELAVSTPAPPPAPAPSPPPRVPRARVAGAVLLALGGLGLLGGVGLAVVAADAARTVQSAARGPDWALYVNDQARGQASAIGAWVAGGLGVALAVTGAVLVARKRPATPARASLAPAAGPSALGGGLRVSW